MNRNDGIMAAAYSVAAMERLAEGGGQEDARKWEAVRAISAKSSRRGDKLLELMERHGALNLMEITADQAEAFLADLRQGTAICTGGCIRNYADPAPHCHGCAFRCPSYEIGGADNGGLSPAT